MSQPRRLALTLTTALALLTSACGQAPAGWAATPDAAALATSARGLALHTFTSGAAGFDTHSHWLDTGKEVVVFDAQFTPALAEQLITRIRATTRSPITTLVITHPNPDKFNGATAFQAIGAQVIASAATAAAMPAVHAYKRHYFVNVARMFTAESYPRLPQVDRTFTRSLTQTVAHVPAARALVVGDLVHHRAHAWLEGGLVASSPRLDVDAWVAALGELKRFRGATVFGGRGEAAPVAEAIAAQQAYLQRARAITKAYVADLGPRVGELDGPEAAGHQAAIAERIAAAFPGHALAYLTGYSIYGLILAVRGA